MCYSALKLSHGTSLGKCVCLSLTWGFPHFRRLFLREHGIKLRLGGEWIFTKKKEIERCKESEMDDED